MRFKTLLSSLLAASLASASQFQLQISGGTYNNHNVTLDSDLPLAGLIATTATPTSFTLTSEVYLASGNGLYIATSNTDVTFTQLSFWDKDSRARVDVADRLSAVCTVSDGLPLQCSMGSMTVWQSCPARYNVYLALGYDLEDDYGCERIQLIAHLI